MTRKEAREIAFAIVFESSFHSEGLDYILENAAEGRDLSLPDGSFAKELARITIEKRDEIDRSSLPAPTIGNPEEWQKQLLLFSDSLFAKFIISAKKFPQAFPSTKLLNLQKFIAVTMTPVL